MLLVENVLVRRGNDMNKRYNKKRSLKKWFDTFTKCAVTIILVISLIDLQLSYVLAFIGQTQIAESLSSTIADTIVGVMIGYLFKALFETFFEKREERLRQELNTEENTNNENDLEENTYYEEV